MTDGGMVVRNSVVLHGLWEFISKLSASDFTASTVCNSIAIAFVRLFPMCVPSFYHSVIIIIYWRWFIVCRGSINGKDHTKSIHLATFNCTISSHTTIPMHNLIIFYPNQKYGRCEKYWFTLLANVHSFCTPKCGSSCMPCNWRLWSWWPNIFGIYRKHTKG